MGVMVFDNIGGRSVRVLMCDAAALGRRYHLAGCCTANSARNRVTIHYNETEEEKRDLCDSCTRLAMDLANQKNYRFEFRLLTEAERRIE